MELDLINHKKIRADNYITILMISMLLLYAYFFTLEALVSLIVYPLVALVASGIIKFVYVFNKEKRDIQEIIEEGAGNFNKILLGIIYIIFGLLFLNFILNRPNITPDIIINIIVFPMMIIGMAGITKGILIDIYSENYRVANILIGGVTLIICIMAFASTEKNYITYVVTLSAILLINFLSRAALYLSEFGLSLVHIKNIKLFFYIISGYLIKVDGNGNLVLSKMV
ncbi:MAG TPA: hypothetical protein ENH75_04455 [archaeon]|nr:hypothetical protein [archaeon]